MQIPAQKCCKEHGKWTEHAANCCKYRGKYNGKWEVRTQNRCTYRGNGSFQLQMLQIARKMVRTGNPKNISQTKKKKNPNNFLPFLSYLSRSKTRFRAKPQPPDGETPWQWRTEKAEKGGEKLPNVTFETHRKWGFLSYLSRSKTRFLGEERPRKTTAPGRGNTMAVKDGEGGKKAAKNCLT